MEELIKVQIENKEKYGLVVSSRIIAEQLGKRHADVISQIEKLFENENVRFQIIESSYKVKGNNKTYKEYLLTKDGFTLYMFNIQGYNDFKMAYINRFNEMEKSLQANQPRLPQTYKEALQALLVQIEENEKLLLDNQEMKPKAEFFEAVTNSKTAIQMSEVAKVLDMGIGRNKLFEILREKKVLMQNNIPMQCYIDRGWFRVIEVKYTKPNGDTAINLKTLVYQKGVNGIRKLLSK